MISEIKEFYQTQLKQLHTQFGNKTASVTVLQGNLQAMGAGFWKAKAKIDIANNTLSKDHAFIYTVLLQHNCNCKNDWPWNNRDKAIAKADYIDWIHVLDHLDRCSPILVDIIPGLDIWLADIFNYIPRDMWTACARLIAKLYRNSKIVCSNIQKENPSVDTSGFFFHKIDVALSSVLNLNSVAKKKGTTQQVFMENFAATEERIEKFGDHAHVHRHMLYLLWMVATYDPMENWRRKIFINPQEWQPHFDNITNETCRGVLVTGLCDFYLFEGYTNALPPNIIDSAPAVLQNFLSTPNTHIYRPYIESKIQTYTYTNPIHQSPVDTQLGKEIYETLLRNPQGQETSVYNALQSWVTLNGIHTEEIDTEEWAKLPFDYLAFWIEKTHSISSTSFVQKRKNLLQSQNQSEKRKLLLEAIYTLLNPSIYQEKTSTEIKQRFFDVWQLIHDPSTFEDDFALDQVLKNHPHKLIFVHFENETPGNFLEKIDEHFPSSKAKQDQIEYTKLLIIVGILMMNKKTGRHKDELKTILHEGILERFLHTTDSKSSIIPTTSYKKLSSLAIWLLNTSDYKGYHTPILHQIIQNLLMECDTETERFLMIWGLVLQQPSSNIYGLLIKNLQFPYHLLQQPPAQYTQIQFSQLFETLQTVTANDIPKHNALWRDFFQTNAQYLEKDFPSWPTDAIQELSDITDTLSLLHVDVENTVVDIADIEKHTPILKNTFSVLKTILTYQDHTVDLTKIQKIESLVSSICSKFTAKALDKVEQPLKQFEMETMNPKLLHHHTTAENAFLFEHIITTTRTFFRSALETEKQYLEHDEALKKGIKFDLLLQKATFTQKYWKHTEYAFETLDAEQRIINSWIDYLIQSDEDNSVLYPTAFHNLQQVFAHYYHPPSVAMANILLILAQKSDKLGTHYYPLLMHVLSTEDKFLPTPSAIIHASDTNISDTIQQGELYLHAKSQLKQKDCYNIITMFENRYNIRVKLFDRTSMHTIFACFIASVISLTQLLDFGGGLLHLFAFDPLTSLVLSLASLGLLFGYSYRKHKLVGIPFRRSIQNVFPSFLWIIGSSALCSWIWMLSEDTVVYVLHQHIILMVFLTSVIIAATKGAFNTE